ncbi:transposase (fragment) (plasmid) [Cupriavidus taiwanensis]
MALMIKAKELGHPADWLLRSQHNRTLPGGGKLWEQVTAGEPVGRIHFTLAARQAQPARAVRQQVWAQRVALPDAAGGVVSATCIVAREVDPPAGVKPIEWRLLSNREVNDLDAAAQLIDWYRARWEVELFFHVLKNGCKRGPSTVCS